MSQSESESGAVELKPLPDESTTSESSSEDENKKIKQLTVGKKGP